MMIIVMLELTITVMVIVFSMAVKNNLSYWGHKRLVI